MRVLPITNSAYNVQYRGKVSQNVAELTGAMSEGWIRTANSGKYSTAPIINTCLFASERINNIFINLSTIMERFGHACELTFEKSKNTGIYRFFIQNKHSNYKVICDNIEFTPDVNKLSDVDKLEQLEQKVAKINPYEENSHFILQRKPESKNILFDSEFVPDEDYIFLEDKLIRTDIKQANWEDIDTFLEAARKEGLIDG